MSRVLGEAPVQPTGTLQDPPRAGDLLGGRWRVAGLAVSGAGGHLVNALDERLRRRVRVFVTHALDPARATLAHPGLPATLDTHVSGGLACLAYPFWSGEPLQLPSRPVDAAGVGAFVERAIGVLEVLELLHQATGHAHGHLSLSSFWRTAEGDWWMLDAAVHGAPDPRFQYPDDDPSDPRSDLYAFAAVLYAVATGQLPFGSGAGAAVAHRRFRLPETTALPEPILDVLRTALQKAPHHRFASAARMVAALQQAQSAVDGGEADPLHAPERLPIRWRKGVAEPTLDPAPPRLVHRRGARTAASPGAATVLFFASLAFGSVLAWVSLGALCLAAGRLF